MGISQELQTILGQVKNSDEWVDICKKNDLETRAVSATGFIINAWTKDDYKNRIVSPSFCSACGTADMPKPVTWQHCVACTNKFIVEDSNYYVPSNNKMYKLINWDDEPETASNIMADPWLNAHHVPDHVIAGEQHDDKMAMFRNEY